MGQPKQLLDFRGSTLLGATLDRVASFGLDHLLVAVGGAAARGGDQPGPRPPRDDERHHRLPTRVTGSADDGGGLPWATRPPVTAHDDDPAPTELGLPELLASAEVGRPDRPFDTLDEDELAAAGRLLEAAVVRWPQRPSRRLRAERRGRHPQLRDTLRRAMRTGDEPLVIAAASRRVTTRPVVVLIDVSGSMEAFARAYLHIARALAAGGRAEVFAFATAPSRIAASLRLRSRRRSPEL